MSCADPNEVDGQDTLMTGALFCLSKSTGWEKGKAGRLPRRDERMSPRAVTSTTYTASGGEKWKVNVEHA